MSKEAQNQAPEQNDAANPAQPDAVAALQAALAAAEEKAAKNWDSYLRGVAELENQRKRGQRDLEQALKYGAEKLLNELLPVKDSLEMALGSLGDKPEAAQLRTGVEMTLRLLTSALERQGVVEVSPVKGDTFDPEWHEAMAAQESSEVARTRSSSQSRKAISSTAGFCARPVF